MSRERAEKYEGEDVLRLLALAQSDEIIDDELTKGRIRTIYIQLRYGQKKAEEIAEYYNLPVEFINDIGKRKIFRDITKEE